MRSLAARGRTVAALAFVLATSSGCFSFWGLSQLTGAQSAWDQNVREEAVPQLGVQETLIVNLPLDLPSPQSQQPATPFALSCRAEQRATDTVYRSAFRYGSRWTKMTAISFLVESALAATILLAGDRDDIRTTMYGGFFAVDAIGTAAIFFIPRKEVFRTSDKAVVTPLRSDCPEGLVLEIGGDSFPVNPAGRIGELGEAALDQWMASPVGALAFSYNGRVHVLDAGPGVQCAWNRAHHPAQAQTCGSYAALPHATGGALSVPVGTLTVVVEETAAAPP